MSGRFIPLRLGTVGFHEALEIQHGLLDLRRARRTDDVFLLLEHPHTYTLGRGGDMSNVLVSPETLKGRGIHFEVISRGGDITYHGPGQIVGYPIVDLKEGGLDVHRFLRMLEQVIILALGGIGMEARQSQGYTGVWVGEEKIASIGIGVRRWITYHGFALNVNTDLSYFDLINPCGLRNARMTSASVVLGAAGKVDVERVCDLLIEAFSDVFDMEPAEPPPAVLEVVGTSASHEGRSTGADTERVNGRSN